MENINTNLHEEIETVLVRYDIGKRPLSLLLGWSDVTLTRYLDGRSKPEKNYIETIERIYNEPDYYLLILERNQNNITPVAYKKSKKVVQELIESKMKDSTYADKIIDNIANEFVAQLNGFNFSTKNVQEILTKINNTVNESILNNKVQI